MRFCGGATAAGAYIPVLCFLAVYGISYCRSIYCNRNNPYQKMLTEGTYYEGSCYEKSEGICVAIAPYFRGKETGVKSGNKKCPCLSADVMITLKMPEVNPSARG